MTRRLISSGSKFEQEVGYSRVVIDGEWIFVSGTTGFDYATMTISDNLFDQTEQSPEEHSVRASPGGRGFRGRRARKLHRAQGRTLRGLLAGAAQIFWREPPGDDHDFGGPA